MSLASPGEFDSVPTPAQDPYSVRAAFRSLTRMRIEILGGLVVALALIPEAISFSIIAGVDPRIGLFASFTMAVTISITGGRRAMISAATGSVALVIAPITRKYGLDYLVVTVLMAGVFQIILALLGVAKLMRFIPRSVMIGFVNALAILIFIAQLPHLVHQPWIVYPLIAAGIAIIVGFPKLTTVVPAPLIAIIVLTILVVATGLDIPNVGDEGRLPDSLPGVFIPNVPLTFQTLKIVAPYAFGMALVALLESLMTAKLVDDVTDTHSNKSREAFGQGVANIVTGIFGGMGGCAMIGQTMINVKQSGSRTRISTFLAGVFLLILVVALNDIVAIIPMAALTAVMIMVSVGTFDWHSIRPRTIRRMPISVTVIMVATVVPTVITNNLAVGVVIGVIVAMLFFVTRVAHFTQVVDVAHPDDETRVYAVKGLLFFASSNDLVYQFDYAGDPQNVIIDLSEAQIYDTSTVAALDAIEQKYRQKHKFVEIVGMNEPSRRWHRLSGKLGAAK
ncbi:SulP family inorganic anion transporter [Microlunatus elymi]|uniref:SulP family inorganic anion transporter n=1 Tax=Microlunatus elymi TaxID=2596828 RepID=A0A516Q300_9ACTN|nr:SulP family inorganic anion transporter [Microlunatus elymi]QDP97805.1 SulP family inorganic anion transporter [Microlunatus elymi]